MSRRNQRQVASQRHQKAQQQKKLIFGGVALVIIAIIALVAYNAIQNNNKIGEETDDLGNAHLESEPTDYIWNTRPPTSGPHAPYIATWGIKTAPVPDWEQVHNLEDGGVIVHYNCPAGCPEIVEELEAILKEIDEDMEQLILQPYPNMEAKIALTAWTRMLTLEEVDKDQIVDFIEAYRGEDHHVPGQG